jgi:hypothetical protein
MAVDNFVLGTFIGLILVSASVVAAIVALEPSRHWRAGPVQGRAGEEKRKDSLRWKKNLLRIRRVWNKGDDLKSTPQMEAPVKDEQLPETVPKVDTQESIINDMSPPANDGSQVGLQKPDEVDIIGIDAGLVSQKEEAASTLPKGNNEKSVEMGNISPKGEDKLPAASLEEEVDENPDNQSPTREKRDWASAFTDIQLEESQAGKLAKTLDDVDIQDLLAQCRALTKPLKKRKP